MKTTRYRCPLCGNSITLHVQPSQPPTCFNPKIHSTRRIEMAADTEKKKTA
jgi:rubrerythrin